MAHITIDPSEKADFLRIEGRWLAQAREIRAQPSKRPPAKDPRPKEIGMTREESEVIQQSLANSIDLLNDIISALATVQNSVSLMAEGLENVEQNLLSIARLMSNENHRA
jgi:hypothetical protein